MCTTRGERRLIGIRCQRNVWKANWTDRRTHIVIIVHTWKSLKYRGSYMSAHVLLNLLNELGKRDKMRGLPSILSLFRNEFNKFNKT